MPQGGVDTIAISTVRLRQAINIAERFLKHSPSLEFRRGNALDQWDAAAMVTLCKWRNAGLPVGTDERIFCREGSGTDFPGSVRVFME